MQRKHALSLSLAAAALMFFLPTQAGAKELFMSSPCPGGAIKAEPVLNVDVTGSTLVGPTHYRFTAYNNGLVTVSRANLIGAPTESAGSFAFADADTIYVNPAVIQQLTKDLRASGVYGLCDQNLSVADIPLTTVTAFRGATKALAHTYSYWVSVGDYAAPALVINDFIADNFPDF